MHAPLHALIVSRRRLTDAVNAKLTLLYRCLGKGLRTEVLGEGRANRGAQLLDQLG